MSLLNQFQQTLGGIVVTLQNILDLITQISTALDGVQTKLGGVLTQADAQQVLDALTAVATKAKTLAS